MLPRWIDFILFYFLHANFMFVFHNSNLLYLTINRRLLYTVMKYSTRTKIQSLVEIFYWFELMIKLVYGSRHEERIQVYECSLVHTMLIQRAKMRS